MNPLRRSILLISAAVLMASAAAPQKDPAPAVVRATLDNGLRVVIVRDPLAPVATVEENYLVGGDETPTGFPGTAHAQEHMAFRGCAGLTGDQIAAIYAQLGGTSNADTQQNITQYFVTVPAQDLEVALRVDSACMRDAQDSAEEWAQERGAIEQEVARDLSNPEYKFVTRLNEDLFSGTPYAHDALGTKESFDKTTAAMLKKFYQDWYAPNNAILVIAGDVDPAATLAKVKELYGPIPRRQVPAHPKVELQPVKPETFTLESNQPYETVFVAFRMPGTSSPDFAAARILADVAGSQRADLYGLVPAGKALGAEFGLAESYDKASVGFAAAAIPANADPAPIIAEMKKILAGYAEKGVPEALVEAARKGEIAGAEFEQNSIPDLAATWSQALAAEGRNSPADIVEAMKKVTLADVNRVAKAYLGAERAIVATLKPAASGEAVASKGFGGSEATTAAPTKPVTLPEWAEGPVKSLQVPPAPPQPADATLANGLRLIVRTEKASPTVTVIGSVRHQAALQTPAGKEGVESVLQELFSYGTATRDRLAFQEALDDIAASESGGTDFNLKVLKQYFAKGVELLADNQLHPALPDEAFQVVREQTAQLVAGELASPGYRTSRALAGRPASQGRSAAAGGHAANRLRADAGRREGLLRPRVPAGHDHHRDYRRHHHGGSPAGDREVVRRVEEFGREAGRHGSGGAGESAVGCACAGFDAGAGLGDARRATGDQPVSLRLLRARAGQSRAGRRILRHAAVSRSPAEERVRIQRRKLAERQRNARGVLGQLRLRRGERLEGAAAGGAGSGRHALDGCDSRGTAAGQGAAAAADRVERIQRGRRGGRVRGAGGDWFAAG